MSTSILIYWCPKDKEIDALGPNYKPLFLTSGMSFRTCSSHVNLKNKDTFLVELHFDNLFTI